MAETPETNKPDFRNAFPVRDLGDGSMMSGQADGEELLSGPPRGSGSAAILRREGYEGPLTFGSADASPPVDRPNLSEDYLAGTDQEEWIPLRLSDYYRDRRIDLLLHSRVSSLDRKRRRIVLDTSIAKRSIPTYNDQV
jgi:NADPH-dependent 2,4-dienoyl-CoA reductase/sulfur reductase-like enzyme